MGDVQITVSGWVGNDPEFHSGQVPRSDRVSFRLACTPRFFDRSQGGYRDKETVWLNVKAWRELAHNIAASVHVGEPVVVMGRLRTQSYTAGGEEKQYQELEASSVGHDLSKGTSMFRRTRSSERDAGAATDRSARPLVTAAAATELHAQAAEDLREPAASMEVSAGAA